MQADRIGVIRIAGASEIWGSKGHREDDILSPVLDPRRHHTESCVA